MHDLTTQVSFLEEEVGLLRRKLADSPRQLRAVEERLAEAQASLSQVTGQNDRLVSTLREARDQILALKEEVDRLAQPPSGFGTMLEAYDDGTADIFTGGRKLRVTLSPTIEPDDLRRGQEVMLNEALNVVQVLEFERHGDVVLLKEILEGGDRALVVGHTDEERIVMLAAPLIEGERPLRAGDSLHGRAPVRLGLRAHPQVRGRGARPRRGPRHRLRPTSAAWAARSRRSATPSSCRSCTRTCSSSTSCARRRASCSTGRPAAARR